MGVLLTIGGNFPRLRAKLTHMVGHLPVVFTGIESFARGHEENLLKLSPQQAEAWLNLIEETGRTPEGMGMTGHFLYIGQK